MLEDIDILAIANALNEANVEEWTRPTLPAFEPHEISTVHEWVRDGGALLLIADHMPFGGAAAGFAIALGFEFTNGYTHHPGPERGRFVFERADDSLRDHPIARGRSAAEGVTRIVAFTGQAFKAESARALMVLPEDAFILLTRTAGEFPPETPRLRAGGLLQGATRQIGAGRVAVFAEAAMFSAQLAGPEQMPLGMNAPGAEQNPQFLLNVMHWLAGDLDD
jgi:hypothetical protein